MGELADDRAEVVLGWFCCAHARLHGSQLRLVSAQPTSDLSCDYLLADDAAAGRHLKIQVTRAVIELLYLRQTPTGELVQQTMSVHQWWGWKPHTRPDGMQIGRHDQFLLDALARKTLRLGSSASDLVLLVYFDLPPAYDEEIDLADMHEAMSERSDVPFEEIWVCCATSWPEGRADRVWPAGS